MDMMEIRRRVLMGSLKSGLGEYTKGYYAVLTPSSTTEFVIPHNLGIIPKVCIVEANFEPTGDMRVGVDAVIAFGAYGLPDGVNEAKVYSYYYNDLLRFASGGTSNNYATENVIRLATLYSTARSLWNTNGTYTVRVMG